MFQNCLPQPTMPLLPLWIDGIPPEMVKKAEIELNETPETKFRALYELRSLIESEEDFEPRVDDIFLLRFLRVKKFNVEQAFKLMCNYYTFKTQYSRIVTDFKPSEFQKLYESNSMDIMPKRMNDGGVIVVLRCGYFDPDLYTAYEYMAAGLLGFELALESEATQICGAYGVIDMKNVYVKMIAKLSRPKFLYMYTKILQDCYPYRIKGFHIVNSPYFASLIYNLLKPFLSKKIRSRVHIHGSNLDSLHQFIPPEFLPSELGGQLGAFDNSDLRHKIQTYEDLFERNIKYGYKGKKSIGFRRKKLHQFLY